MSAEKINEMNDFFERECTELNILRSLKKEDKLNKMFLCIFAYAVDVAFIIAYLLLIIIIPIGWIFMKDKIGEISSAIIAIFIILGIVGIILWICRYYVTLIEMKYPKIVEKRRREMSLSIKQYFACIYDIKQIKIKKFIIKYLDKVNDNQIDALIQLKEVEIEMLEKELGRKSVSPLIIFFLGIVFSDFFNLIDDITNADFYSRILFKILFMFLCFMIYYLFKWCRNEYSIHNSFNKNKRTIWMYRDMKLAFILRKNNCFNKRG